MQKSIDSVLKLLLNITYLNITCHLQCCLISVSSRVWLDHSVFIGKGRLFGSKKTAFNGLFNWSAAPFDSLQIIFGVLFRNASRITLCNLSDIIMVLKLQGL